jgi:hypothetical protein
MEGENKRLKGNFSRKHWIIISVIALLAFGVGIIAAQLFGKPGVTVPDHIAQKVSFPIYLPKRLPGNFQIVKNSFAVEEDVLVFKATDSTGASLVFTEQKRQSTFDFTNFYNTNFKNTKTLSNVPFPSVYGKAERGPTKMLSIVTDETWLFISTLAPLDSEDMRTIATSLKLQP